MLQHVRQIIQLGGEERGALSYAGLLSAQCSYWMHLPHLYSPGQKKRVVTLPWTKIGNSLGSATFCASALDAITCNWTRGPILACCRTVHIAHAQFSPLFGILYQCRVSNLMNIKTCHNVLSMPIISNHYFRRIKYKYFCIYSKYNIGKYCYL